MAQEQATEAESKRVATDTGATRNTPDNKAPQNNAPAVSRVSRGGRTLPRSAPRHRADLIKSVQTELRRVGCLTGAADGEWNAASQRSLALFNKNAGTKFDVKLASLDALDAIKLKPSRVCPLVCEHGFKADGDHCSKIVCAAGSFLNDDNECEKRRAKTPTARRDARPSAPIARLGTARPEASAPKAAGLGPDRYCDDQRCRPVARGCHLEYRTSAQGGPVATAAATSQVCN